MSQTDYSKISAELKKAANKPQSSILQRFFKTGPGQYGAGDIFLGIKVPVQRHIAKKYQTLDSTSLEKLLASKFHEARLVGLLILVAQYEKARNFSEQKKIVDFYLQHSQAINNWDLVDLSVYKILGDFLVKNPRARNILNHLVKSKNLWERRMAMVATFAFLKHGQAEETFRIAKQLLADDHDLIHKAVGWMLREAGKRVDRSALLAFLDNNAAEMPRTALRYAIEHFDPPLRERYLKH